MNFGVVVAIFCSNAICSRALIPTLCAIAYRRIGGYMIILLFPVQVIKCCARACAVVVLLGETVLECRVCSETLTQYLGTCQQLRVSLMGGFLTMRLKEKMVKLHTI